MVATTHLFWDPNYSQIKVTQSMYLLKAIQILRTCRTPTLPVFITMDSNTQPYTYGYNYFVHWNRFVPLRSAYAHYYCNEEPLFTNYTYDFIGCLDYIFFNGGEEHRFEMTGVMELPTEKMMMGVASLPSAKYPSDHLPIAMEGVIHSQKREKEEKEEPFAKARALMTQPFFQYVYCERESN